MQRVLGVTAGAMQEPGELQWLRPLGPSAEARARRQRQAGWPAGNRRPAAVLLLLHAAAWRTWDVWLGCRQGARLTRLCSPGCVTLP